MIAPFLYIHKSAIGTRGVFTKQALEANLEIEVSPVVVLSAKERAAIETTLLFHYIFEWGKNRKQGCMALGYIAMYNHSYDANCEYEMEFDKKIVRIKTIMPVKKNTELFINYNGLPQSKTPLWFVAK